MHPPSVENVRHFTVENVRRITAENVPPHLENARHFTVENVRRISGTVEYASGTGENARRIAPSVCLGDMQPSKPTAKSRMC